MQTTSLTSRDILFNAPQWKHSWVEYAGSTLTTRLPALEALYEVNLTSWPHPASWIDFASPRFLTMFPTRRSSKTTRSCALMRLVESLWLRSALCLLTLVCWDATLWRALNRFFEPLFLRDSARWRRFSLFSAFLR